MKKFPVALIVILISVSSVTKVAGQEVIDTTQLFRLETHDGNEYFGNILEKDADHIVFRSSLLGKLTLSTDAVKTLTPIRQDQIVRGSYWLDNLQASRYFWSPSGYGLKKGEGYYQNIWVLWNQVSYGVTDNFSIGGGMIPLFFFGAGAFSPVWIVPKLSIPVVKDKFNLGAGLLAGNIGFEPHTGFGIAYGTATAGSRNNNLTLGLGYGYLSGNWANRPIITLSGMVRTGRKSYLITENYFIGTTDESLVLIMLGGRSFIRKASIDYGVLFPFASGQDIFFGLPWLGFTLPF